MMLEVKRSKSGEHWHPHLHLITEGDWINGRQLSEQWLKVTGDSNVADVRRIDSGKDVCAYVCKYVTKGVDGKVWEKDDWADEWICSTKGVRVAATFGSWRGYQLLQVNNKADDWTPVSTFQKKCGPTRSCSPFVHPAPSSTRTRCSFQTPKTRRECSHRSHQVSHAFNCQLSYDRTRLRLPTEVTADDAAPPGAVTPAESRLFAIAESRLVDDATADERTADC